MCGIFAYAGRQDCAPVIINGLRSLEYRGYDSWGIALKTGRDIYMNKQVGKVSQVEDAPRSEATVGIGHTRWATHGNVTIENSHPHHDAAKTVYVVHNGIVENVAELRDGIPGETFYSKTDTEIIPKMIARLRPELSFPEAVRKVARRLRGNFAFVGIDKSSDYLVAARNGSPLVVAQTDHDFYISSDSQSLVKCTDRFFILNDGEMVIYDPKTAVLQFRDIESGTILDKKEIRYELQTDDFDKGTYKHFMLKEIYEQPHKLRVTYQKYVRGETIDLQDYIRTTGLADINRIIIIACGTSWHAGLVGEYWLESLLGIPVEVEYASEFRYRHPVVDQQTLVIAISQSGETADTVAAIREARQGGARILAICNVPGSTITQISDWTLYTIAGPEIGVASTKAFTTQLEVLFLLGLALAGQYGKIDARRRNYYLHHLAEIPDKMGQILQNRSQIQTIMENHYGVANALFLGRGVNYPIALEGALKLKEISYIHAEGYPAAEMKHGPIALIDKNMPTVFICIRDSSYEKVISNIQEVKARDGIVIAVANEHDRHIAQLADQLLFIPETIIELYPFLTVLPLQLLAYYIADKRGCDIDKPRNLAKSVTVE